MITSKDNMIPTLLVIVIFLLKNVYKVDRFFKNNGFFSCNFGSINLP
jgi:hypothetical protein